MAARLACRGACSAATCSILGRSANACAGRLPAQASSFMAARPITALAVLAIATGGCGGGRADNWSRAQFERCVGNYADAISVLSPQDMTSAQLEQHQAIAPGFIQVQYLRGEVADIYFASGKADTSAIS